MDIKTSLFEGLAYIIPEKDTADEWLIESFSKEKDEKIIEGAFEYVSKKFVFLKNRPISYDDMRKIEKIIENDLWGCENDRL